MRLLWRSKDGRMELSGEVPSVRAAWAKIAELEEVFDHEACGCCGNMDLFHDVREFSGNTFYKLVCKTCNAQLDYGFAKDDVSIYPKRWDKDTKEALPNGGWYIYQPAPPPPPPLPEKKKKQKTITEGVT